MFDVRTHLQGSRRTPVVRIQASSPADLVAVTQLAADLRQLCETDTVVVDVSGVILTNPDLVRALLGPLQDAPDSSADVRVVATRLTARRLLRRWMSELSLFASVEAALAGLDTLPPPSARADRLPS